MGTRKHDLVRVMEATDIGERARKDFIDRHRRPPDYDDSNSDRAQILAFAHTSLVFERRRKPVDGNGEQHSVWCA